jgi:hypothetical protein
VPETRYLHSKLENGPNPPPSFKDDGFRLVEEAPVGKQVFWAEIAEGSPIAKLVQDREVQRGIEEIRRLQRLIDELEVSREMVRGTWQWPHGPNTSPPAGFLPPSALSLGRYFRATTDADRQLQHTDYP